VLTVPKVAVTGMANTKETYPIARARILTGLLNAGWTVKATLKVPQAMPPRNLNKDFVLRFHAQAVYLNAHSMWIDIRNMSLSEFLATVERWASNKTNSGIS
jgi:hypothetical protein